MTPYWLQYSVSKQRHNNSIINEGIVYLCNDLITTLLWISVNYITTNISLTLSLKAQIV
jgi:hypothetical protein